MQLVIDKNAFLKLESLAFQGSSPARKFGNFDRIYASRLWFGLALR
jgi:hypothetical protein